MSKFFFIIFVSILFFEQSMATCVNTANSTIVRLNSTSLEFCIWDTFGMTYWVSLGGSPLASTCSVAEEGLTKYNGGILQICKSGGWVELNTCSPSNFNCSKIGLMVGSTNGPLFCDGTHWITPGSNGCATLTCESFTENSTCASASADCYWAGNSCLTVQDCSTIFFPGPCAAVPGCGWNGSQCESVY